MTAINPDLDDLYYERGHDPWDTLLPMLLGGVALAIVGGFGLWFLSNAPAPPSVPQVATPKVATQNAGAARSLAAVPARPRANLFGALPDFPQPLEPPLRRTLADLDPKTYGGLGDLVPNPDSAPAAPAQASIATTTPPPLDPPLPPKRDVASIDEDDAPLPPVRPRRRHRLPLPRAKDIL